MARKYESYRVRSWRWTDGSQRMVIEHVQSGTRAVVASSSDAVAWITDQSAVVGDGQGREIPASPRLPSPAPVRIAS